MKEDYYEVLGRDKSLIDYIYEPNGDDFDLNVSSSEIRNSRIKNAFESKYKTVMNQYKEEIKKLEEDYESQKKSLEQKYEKSIDAKKLGLNSMNNNKENTVEKLKIKMENEIKEYEKEKNKLSEEFKKRKTEIITKYKLLLEELRHAFNEIKSPELREINSSEVSRSNVRKHRKLSFETAYDFFGISEERVQSFNPIRADEMLRNECIKKIQIYEKALLDKTLSFSKRKEIETLQILCKHNYELISDSEKRSTYSEYLDNEELKEKYSKVSQFRPELIYFSDNGKFYVYSEKTKYTDELLLKNNMSIKNVATLLYKNSTGVMNSYINQYEIKRNVGDEEKTDYIYTDLDFQQLDIDNNTGKPVNPEYYECVVNELLSEEMIKASKFNSGYIGLVESDNNDKKNKKYRTTLQDKELHPTEQEYLAAVMIYEKSQKDKKIDIEQESDEGR